MTTAPQPEGPSAAWRDLYRRAINEANGLTNYVEDRPELRSAERRLAKIEEEARALLAAPEVPAPVAEPVAPFGCVVKDTRGSQYFYPAGHPPYLDTAVECITVYTSPPPAAQDVPQEVVKAEFELGMDARMRAAGFAGLLSEILGSGAIKSHDYPDLCERIEMAIEDQEEAKRKAEQVGELRRALASPAEGAQEGGAA